MPGAKKGPTAAARPRRDVLASLRMASMEDISRAALPAGTQCEDIQWQGRYIADRRVNRDRILYSRLRRPR
jgi:phosphohistidine phosphatase SixA